MQIFSDGKIQIWCVFNGDGYECCDFVGAFETEEQANEAANLVRANEIAFHALLKLRWEWKGYVKVAPMILGEYRLPYENLEELAKVAI